MIPLPAKVLMIAYYFFLVMVLTLAGRTWWVSEHPKKEEDE